MKKIKVKPIKVKGWVVLGKTDVFDWYVMNVFVLGSFINPYRSAKAYKETMDDNWPGLFKMKLKPCLLIF
jgi:hypothetical protein